MATVSKRVIIVLACTECKSRNYTTTKHREKQRDRLELKKYCACCRRHTVQSRIEVNSNAGA
ncbi:MAG: 50S ribosomal protein L33 [Fimbriimonadales bacterium]|nr:MAG: 50S ribosomal protein L33 [Fimbriimonadales bacterium]